MPKPQSSLSRRSRSRNGTVDGRRWRRVVLAADQRRRLGRSIRKVSRELARSWRGSGQVTTTSGHKRRRRTNQLPRDLRGLGEWSGTLANAGLRKRQLSLRRPRLCRCGRPKRPRTLAGDVAQCRGSRCRQDLGRRVRENHRRFGVCGRDVNQIVESRAGRGHEAARGRYQQSRYHSFSRELTS